MSQTTTIFFNVQQKDLEIHNPRSNMSSADTPHTECRNRQRDVVPDDGATPRPPNAATARQLQLDAPRVVTPAAANVVAAAAATRDWAVRAFETSKNASHPNYTNVATCKICAMLSPPITYVVQQRPSRNALPYDAMAAHLATVHGVSSKGELDSKCGAVIGPERSILQLVREGGFPAAMLRFFAACSVGQTTVEHPAFIAMIAAAGAAGLKCIPRGISTRRAVRLGMWAEGRGAKDAVMTGAANRYVSLAFDGGTVRMKYMVSTMRTFDVAVVGTAHVPGSTMVTRLLDITPSTDPPFTREVLDLDAAPAAAADDDDGEDEAYEALVPEEQWETEVDDDNDDVAIAVDAAEPVDGFTSANIAKYVMSLASALEHRKAIVLNVVCDNARNCMGIRRVLDELRPTFVIGCFAHLGQLFLKDLLNDNAFAALSTAKQLALEIRKAHKNAALPEPVITRWNSDYRLAAVICQRVDDELPADDRRRVDVLPAELAKLRAFVSFLEPLDQFTKIVQGDGCTVGLAVEALSLVRGMRVGCTSDPQRSAFDKIFNGRLTKPSGNFLADAIVIYIAFLPRRAIIFHDDVTAPGIVEPVMSLIDKHPKFGIDVVSLKKEARSRLVARAVEPAATVNSAAFLT